MCVWELDKRVFERFTAAISIDETQAKSAKIEFPQNVLLFHAHDSFEMILT